MKKILCLMIAFAMVLSMAACGGKEQKDPEPSPVQETTEPAVDIKPEVPDEPPVEPAPEVPPEPEGPSGRNPLTGLPMEEEDAAKRPIAVMINNHKSAQPQIGISKADIIYEVPAEGGITRMLVLFQKIDGIGTIGSVRSARLYYAEMACGHDAIYVHAGGSDEAYKNIRSWKMAHIDGVEGGPKDDVCFWRDQDRLNNKVPYEHTLMTSSERLLTYLGKGYFTTEHRADYEYPQEFAEDGTPEGGSDAKSFKVVFSSYKTGEFVYDEASHKYLVSQYGKPHADGANGEQLAMTNVLVLNTTTKVLDSEGRLRVDTIGSGKGTFFCGGKSIAIKWSRKDRNHPFVYTLEDGTPLKLGQGNSYVCIMNPNVSKLEITE